MDSELIAKGVEACQRGSIESIEDLLQSGLRATDVDPDGCSLLHWAAINNRVPVVKRLLSGGAEPNFIGGVLKSTPLHWAARVGNLASCILLVKAGATCNIRDTQGYTPIHLAVQGQHCNLVAYFLEKFDYAVHVTDNSGMNPVMWAAYRTFSIFPLRLFIRKGADLDAVEHLQGNTALHMAVQERNYIAVRELVSAGADVTIRNKQQETPVDIANNNRNKRIQDCLNSSMDASLGDQMKRIRRFFEFLLPGAFMLCTAIMYHFLHYGLASCILLLVVIVMAWKSKFSMHNLNDSVIPIGVCVAEACLMVLLWCYNVHFFAPWWLQIIFFLIMGTLFLSLIAIFFGDPGVVAASPDASSFIEMVESLPHKVNYCFTCWIDKSNARHCSICDRCVRGFDHHCPWLHQCVTRKNLRLFVTFVFCVGASAAIYTGTSLNLIIREIRDYGFNHVMEHRCFMVLTMGLAFFHAIALSGLFITQCYQISSRVTTYDRIQMHRHGRLHESSAESSASVSEAHGHSHSTFQGSVSCCDRISNIVEFCGDKH